MAPWPFSDNELRAMYQGGRGNRTARRFSRLWAAVHSLGFTPRRWVTLEVAGRRSGRTRRFPLGMADWQGDWYLVSMLGEHCNWVQNVRAAQGRATIRHGRPRECRLVEVPASERAPILRRYLQKVPGGRPHIRIGRDASLSDFSAIAARYPVFRVEPGGAGDDRDDAARARCGSERRRQERDAAALMAEGAPQTRFRDSDDRN